tara:strand:- start:5782 stop:6078 length:297 start_codon:yes stop_codon:yes gene_type:complete
MNFKSQKQIAMERHLSKLVKPMLIDAWNLNHKQELYDVSISFAYFPKEYDGTNPPRIRYNLIFKDGRTQENFNCSKPFVEMVDCITTAMYERSIGLDS